MKIYVFKWCFTSSLQLLWAGCCMKQLWQSFYATKSFFQFTRILYVTPFNSVFSLLSLQNTLLIYILKIFGGRVGFLLAGLKAILIQSLYWAQGWVDEAGYFSNKLHIPMHPLCHPKCSHHLWNIWICSSPVCFFTWHLHSLRDKRKYYCTLNLSAALPCRRHCG